ncbi:MAG TPA: hypothetical protein DCO75_04160 [Fibrobacteres bacterium]|jgi:ABC-2 type transport system permease protein|nr:hypothetical protein [Fibrobacterota bacterium]
MLMKYIKKPSVELCGPEKFGTGLIAIMKRELFCLQNNIYLLLIVFFAPMIYPFLYGSVYFNKMERDIPIAVVDLDQSSESWTLARHLDASEMIAVYDKSKNVAPAYELLKEMKVMAIVIIPEGYHNKLTTGQQAVLSVSVNNTRFLIASDISKGLTEVIASLSNQICVKDLQKTGYSNEQAKSLSEPVVPLITFAYNTTESYGDFIIVALLLMILQQSLMIGVAVSMSGEREWKSLPSLLTMANNSPMKLMIGKTGFYFILYSVYALFYYTFHFSFYSLPLNGSVPALVAFTGLHLLTIIMIALCLSSFCKSRLMAINAFLFSSFPIFMLSGYSWPLQSLPKPLLLLTQLIPTTPYLKGYAVLTQMNGSWADVAPQFLHLGILCVTAFIFCTLRINNLLQTSRTNAVHGLI